jgi:type II secretory pathway predicted ATPase ExeA
LYEEHPWLTSLPRQKLPDPNIFSPSTQHPRARTLALDAVETDAGTVLLTGEIGCGKPTLPRLLVLW